MIKLSSLLKESHIPWSDITIDDIKEKYDKLNSWADREYISTLSIIIDYYNGDKGEEAKQEIIEYLRFINSVGKKVVNLMSHVPFVDIRFIKEYLLTQSEFHLKEDSFFPFPVYISASPEDEMTIGIMIDQHGKVLEIHEGNDEATTETINMVNKMVNPKGKPVRIYASHNLKLVQEIEMSEYLPKNLYVSPDRTHASGHMDLNGERTMFTGIIDINSISQESDLDWRTLDKTKIEKFRWL